MIRNAVRALEDERMVGQALRHLYGWDAREYGRGLYAPEGLMYSPQIHAAMDATDSPIHRSPDLVVARGPLPMFVEVTRSNKRRAGGEFPTRIIDRAKMEALDCWAQIGAVVLVDVNDWSAWQHVPGEWDHLRRSGYSAGYGSGTWAAQFSKEADVHFAEMFGYHGIIARGLLVRTWP